MGASDSKEQGDEETLEDSLPKWHSAWEQEKRELQELPDKWTQIAATCCARRHDRIDSPWSSR